ncbi:MAG: hypothetical protein WCL00_01110 [Bacteroidota bacterium]
MENYEKILVLNNEFEAELLEEVLNDKEIPHGIVPHDDSMFEGINQMEFGWGYVEAPLSRKDEILAVYEELMKE